MYFQTNLREKKLHWRNSQVGQRYSISTKLWRILSGEFFSSKFSFTSPLCYRMRFDFEVRSYLGLSYNDEIQVPVFVCLVQLLLVDPEPRVWQSKIDCLIGSIKCVIVARLTLTPEFLFWLLQSNADCLIGIKYQVSSVLLFQGLEE